MATSSSPESAAGITYSYFRKTVSLGDWWLTMAGDDVEEKKLAVSGFTSGEGRAFRVFSSAPITKRRDHFNLESADGVVIILQGFINKDRTVENGFSSQVFNEFFFGFPPSWEGCAEKYFKQSGTDSINNSSVDEKTNDPENGCEENRDSQENPLTEANDPQSSLGCVDEEVVAPKESSSELPADCQDAEKPANHPEDITPSKVKSKRGFDSRHKNKGKKGLKKCSRPSLHAVSDIQQKMVKVAKELRNSSDKLNGQENAEQIILERGSSSRRAKRRIVFDKPVESPRTQESQQKTHILSPDSFKRSRSGRLLLPALEFWRNQLPIYDLDRNITGVQEEVSSSAGYILEKPQKKQRKKN